MKKLAGSDVVLVVLALVLISGLYVADRMKTQTRCLWYEEKVKAAKLMRRAMETVKNEREQRGIPIDKTIDINETGLIGQEYTPITTTLGSLESKRTSVNPGFAAVVVDMLKRLDVKAGDRVAVNFSGSFPALNIAVLAAVETLELQPVIISSVGASSWGANIPEYNYIDMEETLYRQGVFHHRSAAVSLGGDADVARDVDPAVRQEILRRIRDYGRRIIMQPNLQDNIDERLRIYIQNGEDDNSQMQSNIHGRNDWNRLQTRIKCFINVGGNLAAMGAGEDSSFLKAGIIAGARIGGVRTDKTGLLELFREKGIPVINLLNIKKLALAYGLALDPFPIPEIGTERVYYRQAYSVPLIWFLLVLSLMTVIYYGKTVRRKGRA